MYASTLIETFIDTIQKILKQKQQPVVTNETSRKTFLQIYDSNNVLNY